jgi:RHS repeat-associated protein
VKLVRTGNTFNAYKSADGTTWVQVGAADTVTMGQTIYIGLALTSHNNAALNTSLFSNVSVVTKPSAPVLNSATAGDKQVSLSWSASAGATGYKIYYGTTPGEYGTPVSAGNVTASTVTGLTNGTVYYFAVSATNTSGESSRSNERTATPSAPATEGPTLFIKNVDYNASGQMTKVEYGNGDVTQYTYNSLNLRLTRLYTVDKNNTPLQDLNYTYDSVGNVLSITDNVHTADQTFKYDELNRLVEAVNPNPGSYGTKTYVYDKIGNIVEKDGKTYYYGGTGAGPHAVTSLSDGTTFTYDANGNMVGQVEGSVPTAYTYDAENRLTKVTKDSRIIGQYEYDGDGGRTKKTATVSGQTTTTTYVGSLFETSGSRTTKFIFLGGQRVAAVTNSPSIGSTTLYYHADHLGGANVLTDATGVKKELIEYEPFGVESLHEKYGSSEEIAWYYFTGKKTDDESGLIYFGARYYDPKLGRFITADTIVPYPYNPQALNRYSYAGNNPVSHLEDGHGWFKKFWKSLVGGIVGAVVGIVSGNPWLGFSAYNAFTAGMNGGNIGAAVVGGLAGYFGGGLIGNTFGTFWGTVAGGALGGAAGAGIAGGNVGLAALAGMGGSWAGYATGAFTGLAGLGTIIGGGVGSEISGGNFGDGALGGVAYNIGFTLGSTVAGWGYQTKDTAQTPEDSQVFFAGPRIGKEGGGWLGKVYSIGMAVLDPGPFNHTGIGAGNGKVIDSHPDAGNLSGPGIRSVKDFAGYSPKDRIRVVQGRQGLTKAALNLTTNLQDQGVHFGGMPLTGTTGIYCSQFAGQASQSAGQPVYGKGPNSQYWYAYK